MRMSESEILGLPHRLPELPFPRHSRVGPADSHRAFQDRRGHAQTKEDFVIKGRLGFWAVCGPALPPSAARLHPSTEQTNIYGSGHRTQYAL